MHVRMHDVDVGIPSQILSNDQSYRNLKDVILPVV